MNLSLFIILMVVPWAATFFGSILGLKVSLDSQKRQGWLLGFAAGVMFAASIWSLIIPSFEEAGNGIIGVIISTIGFVLGCLGMLLLDKVLPHQHMDDSPPEGKKSTFSKPMLLVMAVALHNIPEGLALGVVIAAVMQNSTTMTWTGALVFALGLALQNFPEGMAVVLPMRQAGFSYDKTRKWGILASFAEPVAAVIGLIAASLLTNLGWVIMPILLSIAAGAMIFIVVEELIPESQCANDGHSATYGILIGFWIMAVMGILGG